MAGKLFEYASLLDEIKGRIRRAQTRAVSSANREMLLLYWDVGRLIESRQEVEGWGSGVIPRLSRDLRNDLPGIKGFSERNLDRMIRFYREYPTLMAKTPQAVALLDSGARNEISPQPVAKLAAGGEAMFLTEVVLALPWGHNLVLIQKVKDLRARQAHGAPGAEGPHALRPVLPAAGAGGGSDRDDDPGEASQPEPEVSTDRKGWPSSHVIGINWPMGYTGVMDLIDHSRPDPRRIEVMDDDMAEVLRAKSGAERLQIAFGMYESTRRMLTSMLSADHSDWSRERVHREVSRRLAHDSG